MKLHFEANLPHQIGAIEAVCDLFRGQEINRTEFTVTPVTSSPQLGLALGQGTEESALGIGNRLTLLDDQLLTNLQAVQLRGGVPPSSTLASGDFTVEMETGTGKTYVYLRSIFELNRRYGFAKFVIVVPSVAIKEGVYKSLQITAEHFRGLYANTPFEYFVYDSAKLGQVRNFATSPTIQVMVITVGAINKFGDEAEAQAEEGDAARPAGKSRNVMYRPSEKVGGERPIDLVRNTRPILIIDEPQSVDGGIDGKGKQALAHMNPLCELRYSATHTHKHHMVYRLNAVDAYDQKLVKQIEVAAATLEADANRPYVRLLSVSNARGGLSAKLELDVAGPRGTVRRATESVQDGDDLEQTTGRALYAGYRIGELRVASARGKADEMLELRAPGTERWLRRGEATGDVPQSALHRQMIRRTIREHLDKEKRLHHRGIKVLSLFFIPSVDKYRQYDADGNAVKGEVALIFEEEYARLSRDPAYGDLFEQADFKHPPDAVHNGYFSIDRKKVGARTVEQFKDTSGTTKADEDTYSLIMRDKERLLDLKTPLKFIFSHSALKEGWDNPNVFQICTLREMGSERERRQTIGRGLRLCVDQNGERVRGFEVNTLTVVATESYESFAENLQKEIEEETGIRFGVVEKHQFAGLGVPDQSGAVIPLGFDQSALLWQALLAAGYINDKGKVQEALKQALLAGAVKLPAQFEPLRPLVEETLRQLSGRLQIRNADERVNIPTRRAVLDSEEFKALWERIKHRTTYRVQFDNEKLLVDCIRAVRELAPIAPARLQWRKADIAIGRGGVGVKEKEGAQRVSMDSSDIALPDVLTQLQDVTQLTRRSIARILVDSGRLAEFKRNPQQYIEQVGEAINRSKRLALVDGIRYQKLGDGEFYAQELFDENELTGYLKNVLRDTQKAVYEHVVYDSDTERDFARDLEMNSAVKVYAKLPGWFKVPTPLGSYNPDWAIVVDADGQERVYFVVETKGSLFNDDLRHVERAKIACGKAHFEALSVGDSPARYVVARTLDDVLTHIQ